MWLLSKPSSDAADSQFSTTYSFVIEKLDFNILNVWHDSISVIDIIILYLNADTLSYIKENTFCENMKEPEVPHEPRLYMQLCIKCD